MAVVTAAEIRDRDSFQAWLEARPEASRRAAITVMASRTALRVMPLLNHRGPMTLDQHTTLIKVAFWHVAISRSVRTWPDREIADAAADTADTAAYANDVAAAYAAYPDAAAADTAYAADAAVEAATSAARASDDVTWEYIRSDAAVIEALEDPFKLNAMPLWQEVPLWWRVEWQAFKTTLTAPDMADGEWGVWIAWYDSITQGHPAFGLKNRQTADALERAIALGGKDNKFHKEFWDREPGEINREIAEWVAEARAAEAKNRSLDQVSETLKARNPNDVFLYPVVTSPSDRLEVLNLPAQSIDATMFGLDADRRIARIAVPPEQRLLITTQQQKEYAALRDDALELSARGQVLGQVGAEIGGLLASLPIDMSHASVFDVWRALNRLRRTMNAHQRVANLPEPHDAKLEPAIAEDLFALLRTANIFAFGDPGLLRRDELAIAPQDKPALQTEKDLGDSVAEAAVKIPELFTDDALGSVVAEESNAAGAGDDAHGQQAIDQTNKTRRNWIAAMLSGLKAERGFAWKEMRSGAYKKTGEAGVVAVGIAVSDVVGFTAIYPAIWNFVSNNGTSLLSYVKTVYQNPALSEFVAWVLKGVGL